MTEKVIGIKIGFKVSETGNFVAITKESLIPVVSVESLEEKVNKLIHHYDCKLAISLDLFVSEMKDLLSAVRKEASA